MPSPSVSLGARRAGVDRRAGDRGRARRRAGRLVRRRRRRRTPGRSSRRPTVCSAASVLPISLVRQTCLARAAHVERVAAGRERADDARRRRRAPCRRASRARRPAGCGVDDRADTSLPCAVEDRDVGDLARRRACRSRRRSSSTAAAFDGHHQPQLLVGEEARRGTVLLKLSAHCSSRSRFIEPRRHPVGAERDVDAERAPRSVTRAVSP